MTMRNRVCLSFVAIGCLTMAPAATAQASHYPGHECSVEVPRPTGGSFCFPSLGTFEEVPQTLYDAASEYICVRTGQCTPVFELPREILCSYWSPPEHCPL